VASPSLWPPSGPGRQLRPEEAAWLGAMLDAEGCVTTTPDGHRVQYISISNTEIELISAVLRAAGVGTVWALLRKASHHRQAWRWQLARIADLTALLPQLEVYSLKAQRALSLIRPMWERAQEARKPKTCIDCGQAITKRTRVRRCWSCAGVRRWAKRKQTVED